MSTVKWLWPLVLGGAAAAAAHAQPITFEQAVGRAQGGAPSVLALEQQVRAAQAAAPAASALPDPKLSLGLENVPISGPMAGRLDADEMTMARIGVMQEVPSRAKRMARAEAAAAEVGMARASRDAEALRARLAAAEAWLDLHYARRRLAALDEIQTSLDPLWKTLPARVAAGSARPGESVEADQWRAELADQRSELRAAESAARAALARWTGEPAPEPAGPAPAFALDGRSLSAGLDDLPAIREAAAQRRQAEAAVDAARAEKRPDWAFEAAYQRRDPMFGDMVSVGVTVSLPLFASTRQEPVIAARTSELGRARLEVEARRRELQAELEAGLAEFAARQERLKRARDELVPLADRRVKLEVASYGAGAAGLAEVLMAFDSLADVKLDEIVREAELAKAGARIALTFGSPPQ